MLKKVIFSLLSCTSLFGNQDHVAKANGIDIWYETFGEKENPALLLIMGGCCQGVLWSSDFCEKLADEGFYVVRYDHRDTGLSTCFDFNKSPYDPLDMTKDAVGLLDFLGIQKAHLFGVSLGSMIAELMAAYYPQRAHSILLLGSSCDIRPMNRAYAGLPPDPNSVLPSPLPHYLNWMIDFMKLSPQTDDEKLIQRLEGWNKLNGQKIPLNETIQRRIHKEFLSRNRYPQGILNHILSLRNTRAEELVREAPSRIHVPTIILHGTEDPIFPPEHGEALHRAIPGSEYHLVEGMGHVPNDHFNDFYIEILKRQSS